MKVIPHADIVIDGKHAEARKAVETSDHNARSLVAQGFAIYATKETKETAEGSPAKETATAKPAKETASRK